MKGQQFLLLILITYHYLILIIHFITDQEPSYLSFINYFIFKLLEMRDGKVITWNYYARRNHFYRPASIKIHLGIRKSYKLHVSYNGSELPNILEFEPTLHFISAWGNPESAFKQDIKEAWASGIFSNDVRTPFPHLIWLVNHRSMCIDFTSRLF